MHDPWKHLLDLESLSENQILSVLKLAASFNEEGPRDLSLSDKKVANLFFENSTRTRCSFEIASKRLGMEVINLNVETSSAKKGEGLLDTVQNLAAMGVDLFIVRHPCSGAAAFLAKNLRKAVSIINAGDGCHEHPSQGLLDLFTIQHYKKNFAPLKVAIIGDIAHSRVARSLIHGLRILGVTQICVIGPKTLMPKNIDDLGVRAFYQLEQGIQDADVIVTLRLQKERMSGVFIPSEAEYHSLYGIDEERLKQAKSDVIVMHPGPVNCGVEISSAVAEGRHSVILDQVSFGIAVRMAIIKLLLKGGA